jgi:putative transposase
MAGNGWKLRASRKEDKKESDKDDAVDGSRLLELALSSVLCLLSFEMQGYYSARDIALVVIQACSRAVSINQTCKDMVRCPARSTVRHHLSKLRMKEMERSVNEILPRWAKLLPRRALKIAIDLTYIPYHGKPKRSKAELKNGPAKQGTTWFHVYASAYVVLYGKRYTLALRYARRNEPLTHVIGCLLNRMDELDVRVGCLYLDRGFYTIEVISYLKRRKVPFVMPVVRRGKKGGTRALLTTKRSYTTEYTMKNAAKHREVSFSVHVVRIYLKSRYGRHGSECYGYVVSPVDVVSLRRVFDEYRRRFGIESSYRLMNESRARTSSRDPKRRLLFVAVSFILINTWVYVKWESLSVPVRGRNGRRVIDELLPYMTVLMLVNTAINRIYGAVTRIVLRP